MIEPDDYIEWEDPILNVKKIDCAMDLYGVMLEVRIGRYKRFFALVEIEPINLDKDSEQAIDNYLTWFCNR